MAMYMLMCRLGCSVCVNFIIAQEEYGLSVFPMLIFYESCLRTLGDNHQRKRVKKTENMRGKVLALVDMLCFSILKKLLGSKCHLKDLHTWACVYAFVYVCV